MSMQGKLRRAVARTGFCVVVAAALPVWGQSSNVKVLYTSAGEANLDGKVNALDFNALATNFGSVSNLTGADFNYDGRVNAVDFNQLAANFGTVAMPQGETPQDVAQVRLNGKSSQAINVNVEGVYLPRVLQQQIDSANFNINPEALKALTVADRSLLYYSVDTKNYIGSGGSAPKYYPNLSPENAAIAAARSTERELLYGPNYRALPGLAELGTRPTSVDSAKTPDSTFSLNGADFLADHGWNYLDILHFYYGADTQLGLATPANAPNLGLGALVGDPQRLAHTKTLADVEHDEGIFQSAGAPNRFMQNIAHTNQTMAFRSFKSPHKGTASEQISIDYDESAKGKPFVYRLFTDATGGDGTALGNLLLPGQGEIGFYLRTTTPNLKTAVALKDTSGTVKTALRHIIADDKWHKYVWDVDASVSKPFTLNSLYLTGNSDATVHIDGVFFNEVPNGSTSSGGGLTKSGSGTLMLVGSNSYTGGMTVNTGTVAINGGAIGTFTPANLTINGGTLNFSSGAGTVSLSNVALNNSFNAISRIGSVTITGSSLSSIVGTLPAYLSSSASTITSASGLLQISGGTFGIGGVLMTGNGTLLLSDLSQASQFAALAQPSGIPGTVLVPEPSAIGLLVATPALLHRRRKSEI